MQVSSKKLFDSHDTLTECVAGNSFSLLHIFVFGERLKKANATGGALVLCTLPIL